MIFPKWFSGQIIDHHNLPYWRNESRLLSKRARLFWNLSAKPFTCGRSNETPQRPRPAAICFRTTSCIFVRSYSKILVKQGCHCYFLTLRRMKQVFRKDHGGATSRTYRKLWQTDQPSNRSTDWHEGSWGCFTSNKKALSLSLSLSFSLSISISLSLFLSLLQSKIHYKPNYWYMLN